MTDLRTGIIATANALGMDPVDLATIMSYETAGTFDPMKAGPTTQWGQHKGLIQFGEPQAREYGVDWNDPLGSQLGENGAVANYFRKNGWQPGMGLLDAYSIVNAGGPGLYNASDANNGGAPGTVADKVNDQMGGHREKAAALLGGEFSPSVGFSGAAAMPDAGGAPLASLFGAVDPASLPGGAGGAGGFNLGSILNGRSAQPKPGQDTERKKLDQDRRIALADMIRY